MWSLNIRNTTLSFALRLLNATFLLQEVELCVGSPNTCHDLYAEILIMLTQEHIPASRS